MTTITIDLRNIESRIALFTFCEEVAVAEALRTLVLDHGAEVNEHRIELEIDEIRRRRVSRSDS